MISVLSTLRGLVMSIMLSVHIIFLILWSASLLYFPQLLVKQATEEGEVGRKRAAHMQRALFVYVMTPSALIAVFAGTWLILERGFAGGWLPVKLALVLAMVFYQIWCATLMAEFRARPIQRHMLFYRSLPLLPVMLISATLVLVLAKPF